MNLKKIQKDKKLLCFLSANGATEVTHCCSHAINFEVVRRYGKSQTKPKTFIRLIALSWNNGKYLSPIIHNLNMHTDIFLILITIGSHGLEDGIMPGICFTKWHTMMIYSLDGLQDKGHEV